MRSPPKDLTEGVFNENVAYIFLCWWSNLKKKTILGSGEYYFYILWVYFLLSFYIFLQMFSEAPFDKKLLVRSMGSSFGTWTPVIPSLSDFQKN
jgi:hypothetical protein